MSPIYIFFTGSGTCRRASSWSIINLWWRVAYFGRFFFNTWFSFIIRGQNGRLAHCKCKNAALTLDLGLSASAARSCCIFTRAVSESPVWPHVLNHIFLYKFMRTRVGSPFTSKMRRNSTSLDSCQHDDIKIVTVSVARRRWTAPLKHFTTFYALLKHVAPKGDYFTRKGHFFAP